MKKYILIGVFITLLLITQFSGNFESSKLSFSEIPPDFVYDGCSSFPDGNYGDCCKNHDDVYFFGGSWQERLSADNMLMSCVRSKGGYHKILGPAMWLGVRFGGTPVWLTSFRWGFGRDRY